jgi:hypothetical protein
MSIPGRLNKKKRRADQPRRQAKTLTVRGAVSKAFENLTKESYAVEFVVYLWRAKAAYGLSCLPLCLT